MKHRGIFIPCPVWFFRRARRQDNRSLRLRRKFHRVKGISLERFRRCPEREVRAKDPGSNKATPAPFRNVRRFIMPLDKPIGKESQQVISKLYSE